VIQYAITELRCPSLGQDWLGHLCGDQEWGVEQMGQVGSGALHSGCECPNFQHFLHYMSFEAGWAEATLQGHGKKRILSPNFSTFSGVTDTTTAVMSFSALISGSGWRKRAPWIGVSIPLPMDSKRQE